jgi:pimeloyl-ACP methyl ester carboxylesterase
MQPVVRTPTTLARINVEASGRLQALRIAIPSRARVREQAERQRIGPLPAAHGVTSPGWEHDWDPVLDILAEGSRAIAPELPIFDPALARVSVEAVADWVLRFLDALGLDQVVLGGNSLGGHVALAAALAAPERVSALILTGSSGLWPATESPTVRIDTVATPAMLGTR